MYISEGFFRFVYLRERQREHAQDGGGQQRERGERESQHTVSTEPDMGLNLTNREIMA